VEPGVTQDRDHPKELAQERRQAAQRAEQERRFEEVTGQQGWNTDSQLQVTLDFIAASGLTAELGEYAERVAATENAGSTAES
jgi:hypothetical protein